MDLLDQLETYINAQKGVGLHAILFGSGLLITSLLFYLLGEGSLSNGIRNGSLVLGILLLFMGFGIRKSQENILKDKIAIYQKIPFNLNRPRLSE